MKQLNLVLASYNEADLNKLNSSLNALINVAKPQKGIEELKEVLGFSSLLTRILNQGWKSYDDELADSYQLGVAEGENNFLDNIEQWTDNLHDVIRDSINRGEKIEIVLDEIKHMAIDYADEFECDKYLPLIIANFKGKYGKKIKVKEFDKEWFVFKPRK